MNRLRSRKSRKSSGFTIVELLVVIVVIAILAAITIVAYTGISQKAVASSLQSDLDNASKQLKLYQVDHSAYPVSLNTSNCPLDSSNNVDTNYCLKLTSGNSRIGYSANNSTSSQSFLLIAGNGNTNYQITNTTAPVLLAQLQPGVTPGAALELHAAKANNGTGPGINSPLTTTWKDTSGNGNNGTLTGFGGETPWAGAGTPSDPYRLVFDGTDDTVVVPQPPGVTNTPLTAEIWFGSELSPAWSSFIMNLGPLGGISDWDGGGHISAIVWGAGSYGYRYISSLLDSRDGHLHHGVYVVGDDLLTLYLDGASVGSQSTNDDGFVPYALGPVTFAQGSWDGSVGAARLYPFAFTPAQVATNYAAGPDW